MRPTGSTKPAKPYKTFPLFAHASGQWAKKILGKFEYFGPWADHDAALAEYRRQHDYVHAGQTPPAKGDTVADLLNAWLATKQHARDMGEIGEVTYTEYEATTDVIAAHLGRSRPLDAIQSHNLGTLRKALGQGKTKALGPVTLKRRLTVARMVMKYAKKLGTAIDYEDELKAPSAKLLRSARSNAGERLFAAKQIRQMVKAASLEMRVIVLLGINCGFGPDDCCQLPMSAVDLKGGWHNFGRPKTGMARRCSLWPETLAAIKAIKGDPKRSHVIVGEWNRHRIADEVRKLVDDFYVKGVTAHYSLRRTFETIATTADVSQAVIDSIMGHARQDMASIYRQKTYDVQLRKCADHVRLWYLGKLRLE